MTPQPSSLNQWIEAIGRLSVHEMDLGLVRVRAVWRRMHRARLRARVVTIAGTNGKGTCAHFIERTLRADGVSTGLYTSPHLLRFNERVQINGEPASDDALCAAFARVEHARNGHALTVFEFTTLAALWCFAERALEVVVLEVGLGGRLDAVNIIAPDVAVVTRIGLDHTELLGDTLEAIAREKAGIFRRARPAIVCRADAPPALAHSARQVGAKCLQRGRHFDTCDRQTHFDWRFADAQRNGLPRPGAGPLDSFAGGLAALAVLGYRPSRAALDEVLGHFVLAGRQQWVDGTPAYLLDVAHNPQAGRLLARRLAAVRRRCRLIVGMLASKDTGGFVATLRDVAHSWHVVPTDGPRGLTAAQLGARLEAAGVGGVTVSASVAGALARERARAAADDVIVVCGSFQTVGPALAWLGLYSPRNHQRPSSTTWSANSKSA